MDTAQPQEPKQLFARSLELLSDGKIEEWVGLFADDGILEFPYPAPGFPSTMQGRDALLAQMTMFAEQLRIDFSEPEFHVAAQDLVVAAYTAECTLVATGGQYHQTYLSVVRFENGRITLFRDFWNPWLVMEAAGGEVAWKQALQALAGS
jgi:ketosteroid isomerase-like protein